MLESASVESGTDARQRDTGAADASKYGCVALLNGLASGDAACGGGVVCEQLLESEATAVNDEENGNIAGDEFVVAACDVEPANVRAGGATSSAPKRKRGRPKGKKNEPKTTDDTASKGKRGRLAGSKPSPKRNLTLALGHAQADATPAVQPSSVAPCCLFPLPAKPSAVALEQNSEADSMLLRDTTGPGLSSPATSTIGAQRRSPVRPPLIPALYVDTLVAFSPE